MLRGWRTSLMYVATIGFAVLTLLLVLPRGDEVHAAPDVPTAGTVSGPGIGCLGDRLIFDQSGVFLVLRDGDASGTSTSNSPAPQVAEGRIDRTTGAGTLSGTCASGSTLEGGESRVTIRIPREGGAVEGSVAVDDEVLRFAVEPDGTTTPAAANRPSLPGSEVAARALLAVAVIVVAARAVGSLLSWLRQPRVVGEILAGILLGPSLLGLIAPDVVIYLFPKEVTDVLKIMAQFGLVFFMFFIGAELDQAAVRRAAHSAVLISHVSIALPFSLGVIVSLWLYPLLGQGDDFSAFALFIGAAMAITAFPVLARILTDTGLDRSRIGALALACAAVDDITAWSMLAAIVGLVNADGPGDGLRVAALSLVYVAAMLRVVRPVVHRVISVQEGRGRTGQTATAGILALVLVSAFVTEWIGIHAIFGAFMAGAVMPRSSRLLDDVTGRLEDVTVLLLMPIFFAVVGLSTRFGLLDQGELWGVVALVIAVAVIGKWGGSMAAARAAGWGWRASTAIGLLMNTRGLTEIIILTIGRELGLLSPALFTIMIIMTLVTTAMATPLLSIVYPDRLVDRQVDRAAAARRLGQGIGKAQRVVVGVGNPDHAGQLVDFVAQLRTVRDEPPRAVLCHAAPRQELSQVRMRPRRVDAGADAAMKPLEPLVARLAAAGIEVQEVVASAGEPASELARLARAHTASLLVVGQHHAYFGTNPLGGAVGELLQITPCDVAVVLDPPDGASAPSGAPVAVVHHRVPGEPAALDVAVALARGRGVELVTLEPAGPLVGEPFDVETGVAVRRRAVTEEEALAIASAASYVVVTIGSAADARFAAAVAAVTRVVLVHPGPRHAAVAPATTDAAPTAVDAAIS